MKRAGWELSKNEVNDMLAEYGLEHLERLHFDEFCVMFQGSKYLDPGKLGKITGMYTKNAKNVE